MLKIENTEVLGWEHAIRGMRNPMNSWAKSDSEVSVCECERWPHDIKKSFACLGSNDFDLMKRLRNAGTDHRKFMRMIVVYVDLTAPLYWWKEFDTYKVGRTVMLNYEVLANIYKSRRNHKLDEWHTFCDWIEGLPYSELITGPSLKDIPISDEIMEEAKRRVHEELDAQLDYFCKSHEGFSIKIPKEKVAPEVLNLIDRVEREEQQRVKFGNHIPLAYYCQRCDAKKNGEATDAYCQKCPYKVQNDKVKIVEISVMSDGSLEPRFVMETEGDHNGKQ